MVGGNAWAQNPPAPPAPANPTPDAQLPGAQTPTAPQPSGKLAAPKEVASEVNNGFGLSFEPIFWFTTGRPQIRRGALDTQVDPGNFTYSDQARNTAGAEGSIPIGKNGTIRVSFVQAEKTSGTILPSNINLFAIQMNQGDFLAYDYKIQVFKASYDYLTYFWHRGNSDIRLKTLWEFQRISFGNDFADFSPNADGTFTSNPASGTKSVSLPTFGLGLEEPLSKHFRWEVKGSGFGLYHGGAIGDAEASIAIRRSHFELRLGGRYLYFKTSAKKDQYNVGSLSGPFASIRYYWKKQ